MSLPCIIMAGGEGSRLRPLTVNRPKPMIPIVNRPILEHTLESLKREGFKDFYFTLHYLPKFITDYFEGGSKWGVKIEYSIEERPLGTAGGVKKICEGFDRVLVWSGDVLAFTSIIDMINFHEEGNSVVTMAVTRVDDPSEFGVVVYDEEFKIIKFQEKPSKEEALSNTVNCGIYILEKEALELIPDDREFDFSKDLFPLLLKKGLTLRAWPLKGFWSDIGTHSQYFKTNIDLLNNPKILKGKKISEGIIVGNNVEIEEDVDLIPPLCLGNGVTVKKGCKLGPKVIIGNNSFIKENSRISNSILWESIHIGSGVGIEEAIIGDRCFISDGVQVLNDTIIGDECKIGRYSIVKPGIKVWPGKVIEAYSIVSSNLKWGIKWPNHLFSYNGIIGQVNLEITPELATKLGSALGSWLGLGKVLAVGRDNSLQARVIKRALISGLLASGIEVEDLKDLPLPTQIDYLLNRNLNGGVYISSNINQPEQVNIRIFNYDGLDLDGKDQRSVESIFFKEELRRVTPEKMGSLIYPEGYLELYLKNIYKRFADLKVKDLRVVLDLNEGVGYQIIPSLVDYFRIDGIILNSRTKRSNLKFRWIDNKMLKILNSVEADLGIVFDESCEKIALITRDGKVYSGEDLLLLISYYLIRKGNKDIVVSPALSRWVLENLKEMGYNVVKASRNLGEIGRLARAKASLGGDEAGRVILPTKGSSFDGIVSMLTSFDIVKEGLHKELDKRIEKNKLTCSIPLPKNLGPEILSNLVRETKGYVVELINGVKIEEDLGSLTLTVLTDSVELSAEARSDEQAERLLRIYEENIKSLIKRHENISS